MTSHTPVEAVNPQIAYLIHSKQNIDASELCSICYALTRVRNRMRSLGHSRGFPFAFLADPAQDTHPVR